MPVGGEKTGGKTSLLFPFSKAKSSKSKNPKRPLLSLAALATDRRRKTGEGIFLTIFPPQKLHFSPFPSSSSFVWEEEGARCVRIYAVRCVSALVRGAVRSVRVSLRAYRKEEETPLFRSSDEGE